MNDNVGSRWNLNGMHAKSKQMRRQVWEHTEDTIEAPQSQDLRCSTLPPKSVAKASHHPHRLIKLWCAAYGIWDTLLTKTLGLLWNAMIFRSAPESPRNGHSHTKAARPHLMQRPRTENQEKAKRSAPARCVASYICTYIHRRRPGHPRVVHVHPDGKDAVASAAPADEIQWTHIAPLPMAAQNLRER